MNVQKVSREVKKQEWIQVIKDCRESGMPVKHWCRLNHINEQSYYCWLKKVRVSLCEIVQGQSDTSFVPVQITADPHPSSSSAAAILYKGDIRIEISNDISPELLTSIMRSL